MAIEEHRQCMGLHVVITLNDNGGVSCVYGPFATGEEAVEWADKSIGGDQWYMVDHLYSPEEAND